MHWTSEDTGCPGIICCPPSSGVFWSDNLTSEGLIQHKEPSKTFVCAPTVATKIERPAQSLPYIGKGNRSVDDASTVCAGSEQVRLLESQMSWKI